MNWSTTDRQRFLETLGGVERAIVSAYRMLLALIIAGIVAVTVYVIVRPPWGAGNQGEWFYFSVAVLIALVCTIGKYQSLGRRHRQWDLPASIPSNSQDGVHTWELQFGAPPADTTESPAADPQRAQFSFSSGFEIPIASLAREVLPDEAALSRAEAELACGVELDEVCRAIQPAYRDWNAPTRWAFRHCVTSLLDQRRSTAGGK